MQAVAGAESGMTSIPRREKKENKPRKSRILRASFMFEEISPLELKQKKKDDPSPESSSELYDSMRAANDALAERIWKRVEKQENELEDMRERSKNMIAEMLVRVALE